MIRPGLEIDDLRAFGPHRLRASLLTEPMEARGALDDGDDRFLDAVDELAWAALTRARGVVRVRLWLVHDMLVATVSAAGRGTAGHPRGRWPQHVAAHASEAPGRMDPGADALDVRMTCDGVVVRLETSTGQGC